MLSFNSFINIPFLLNKPKKKLFKISFQLGSKSERNVKKNAIKQCPNYIQYKHEHLNTTI